MLSIKDDVEGIEIEIDMTMADLQLLMMAADGNISLKIKDSSYQEEVKFLSPLKAKSELVSNAILRKVFNFS